MLCTEIASFELNLCCALIRRNFFKKFHAWPLLKIAFYIKLLQNFLNNLSAATAS